jgi:Fur family zinc uptake transcriptional regulator
MVSAPLQALEQHCAERKLRLTPLRTRVFEILASEAKLMGAYEILAQLKTDGMGSEPPVAYRALDFLTAHGFAHKIGSTYIACAHVCQDHAPAFLVCTNCKCVTEIRAPRRDSFLHDAADNSGFTVSHTVLEAHGICSACKR